MYVAGMFIIRLQICNLYMLVGATGLFYNPEFKLSLNCFMAHLAPVD